MSKQDLVHLTDTDSRVTPAEEYAEPGSEVMFPIISHLPKEAQRIQRVDASLAKQLQNSMERNSRLSDTLSEHREMNTKLHRRIVTLVGALEECLEYFKDKYDVVDGSYGEPAPNKEMQLGSVITEALYGPGVV